MPVNLGVETAIKRSVLSAVSERSQPEPDNWRGTDHAQRKGAINIIVRARARARARAPMPEQQRTLNH